MKPVQIIDYGVGNKKSMMNAISALGFTAVLRENAKEIDPSAAIILPGVGSFAFCKKKLVGANLFDALYDVLHSGSPACFIGICVGMQLLFKKSVEDGHNSGFDYFDGEIISLSENVPRQGEASNLLPNTHWGRIEEHETHGPYYFTHSFGNLASLDRKAYYNLGDTKVTAVAQRGAVTGFQFHPEKSAEQGLGLLRETLNQVKV